MDSLVRGNDVGKAGIVFRHAANPGDGPAVVSMVGLAPLSPISSGVIPAKAGIQIRRWHQSDVTQREANGFPRPRE